MNSGCPAKQMSLPSLQPPAAHSVAPVRLWTSSDTDCLSGACSRFADGFDASMEIPCLCCVGEQPPWLNRSRQRLDSTRDAGVLGGVSIEVGVREPCNSQRFRRNCVSLSRQPMSCSPRASTGAMILDCRIDSISTTGWQPIVSAWRVWNCRIPYRLDELMLNSGRA
jgi:hypothetical protein